MSAAAAPADAASPEASGAGAISGTPIDGAKWRSRQHGGAQAAAAGAPAGAGLTPTPETPLTKLATRPSTTPGGLQPLSPRAAAAALDGTPQAEQPASPRGAAKRVATAAANAVPLSPRGAQRGGRGRPFAASPRAAAAAVRLQGSSDDETAEPQPRLVRGGPGRRRRRRAAAVSDDATDSEDEAGDEDSSGNASDSAEDAVRQRPRRAAKKAALFSQADYAFDEEVAPGAAPAAVVAPGSGFVATSMEALAAFAQPAAPGGGAAGAAPAAAGPPAPVRRRRKPAVAQAAPTGGQGATVVTLALPGFLYHLAPICLHIVPGAPPRPDPGCPPPRPAVIACLPLL